MSIEKTLIQHEINRLKRSVAYSKKVLTMLSKDKHKAGRAGYIKSQELAEKDIKSLETDLKKCMKPIVKKCMICDVEEQSPSGTSNVLRIESDICITCKAVLRAYISSISNKLDNIESPPKFVW